MKKKTVNEIMGTESVKIDTGLVDIVRSIKVETGIPIGRFIEEAIVEKALKLPKKVKDKIVGLR